MGGVGGVGVFGGGGLRTASSGVGRGESHSRRLPSTASLCEACSRTEPRPSEARGTGRRSLMGRGRRVGPCPRATKRQLSFGHEAVELLALLVGVSGAGQPLQTADADTE